MALRGEPFLLMVKNFRLCWLGGRYGSGKTSLAVRLAIEFVHRGWARYIVTNFPSVVSDDIQSIPPRDAVVILDEAGVFLRDAELDRITAYLRKFNITLLLASVIPVSQRARTLNIQRVLNYSALGIPMWYYSAQLDYMRVRELLYLQWWRPSELWGIYDTSYVAQDDAGIIQWLAPIGVQQVAFEGRQAFEFDQAAEKLTRALSIPGAKRRR
jgi:hypothetical protein